jgi:DNA-directed RNA polymerase specialized sigma subunit
VITLVFYEELNIKEIAEILECSEAEALDLYKRAMKNMEELTVLRLNRKV